MYGEGAFLCISHFDSFSLSKMYIFSINSCSSRSGGRSIRNSGTIKTHPISFIHVRALLDAGHNLFENAFLSCRTERMLTTALLLCAVFAQHCLHRRHHLRFLVLYVCPGEVKGGAAVLKVHGP